MRPITGRGKLRSRAVVVASGAKYQSLPIDGIEVYEGRGIYYGATPMEAQLCGNAEVTVVGSGNSAGQGAIYLASVAKKVYVIFRRKSLRETMSEYLVKRLEEHPNVELHAATDVVALHGADAGVIAARCGAAVVVADVQDDLGTKVAADIGGMSVFQRLDVDIGDKGPDTMHRLQQAFAFQPDQNPTQGCAAGPELCCQILL